MKIIMSKRNFVRIITFVLALFLVAFSCAVRNKKSYKDVSLKLENTYIEAIESLASSTDNINTTLKKGIYAGSPKMLSELSSKLWHDSSIAKSALSQLPMGDNQLEKTNKFLSQVGNYAVSISEKASNGEGLSLEEYTNLAALSNFSDELKTEMWELETKIQSGQIKLNEVYSDMNSYDESKPPQVYEGFTSMEEGFENYPTLIYDGPFSDHITQKQPLMIQGKVAVSQEQAIATAAKACNVDSQMLNAEADENSTMPSFRFGGENTTVSVTKAGGLLSYMLKSRKIGEPTLSVNDALSTANIYLQSLEINNMITTYYETYGDICTINFAGALGDKTVYTDLIKVSVALDNGEILGFDARGYIVNHFEREDTPPSKTVDEAKEVISPLLTINKSKLAIIPSKGLDEVLAYEFNCTSRNGTNVLVYVNADTLEEEQILLLYITENGVLTV